MSAPRHHNGIDYIELPCTNPPAIKAFYSKVFGWTFQDWGPDYISFNDGRLDGGFTTAEPVTLGGARIILYSRDLEKPPSPQSKPPEAPSTKRSSPSPEAAASTSDTLTATTWPSGPNSIKREAALLPPLHLTKSPKPQS